MTASTSLAPRHRSSTVALLALISAPLLSGCGLVLGLDDYELDDDQSSSLGGAGADQAGTGGSASGGSATGGAASGGSGTGGAGTGGADIGECEGGCEDFNDCTTDACIDGRCAHTTVSAGESCQSGVCNGSSDSPACIRCIDDQSGSGRDLGCTEGAPICDESGIAVCTGCTEHSDCNDGDLCTADSCNAQGECSYAPDDSDPSCTATCIDDRPGAEQDTGCSSDQPVCAGGTCVTCVTHDHCSGGTACEPFLCEMGSCVQRDVRQSVDLITTSLGDGSFELGASSMAWLETGPNIRYNCSDDCEGVGGTLYQPSEGNFLGWLAGNNSISGSLYKILTLPSGLESLQLKVDTNFRTDESTTSVRDTMGVTLQDLGGNVLRTLESRTNADARQANAMWDTDGINGSYGDSMQISDLADQTVRLSFEYSTNGSQITDFMIDRVRLTAEICE